MYRTTMFSIDAKLNDRVMSISQKSGKDISDDHDHETDRPVIYLYWGQNKKLLKTYPENVFLPKDLTKLNQLEHQKNLKTVVLDGNYYRVLSIPATGVLLHKKMIKLTQLVYNINPEKDMLKDMLIMVGIGSAAGLLFSFLAGLFLASKALVPIQRSWEKQSQFVADASHELRTPLAVIQTHLELLFRHPSKTIEEESETIFKSLSEVKRINKLVEELLTLARSDSNEQQIQVRFFKMDELLTLIVEQMKPIAEMKEIRLVETIENNLKYYGDQERLHQLFVILLDNALKFTPAEGTVFISCKREGSILKIVIRDTGVGILEKDLPYIFDRFYRGDKSRSRSQGGTGLGLSIAKWIVEAHHGQIGVESRPKEGTSFLIKLPVKGSF
jgi:signal transduction histidine kinase